MVRMMQTQIEMRYLGLDSMQIWQEKHSNPWVVPILVVVSNSNVNSGQISYRILVYLSI